MLETQDNIKIISQTPFYINKIKPTKILCLNMQNQKLKREDGHMGWDSGTPLHIALEEKQERRLALCYSKFHALGIIL